MKYAIKVIYLTNLGFNTDPNWLKTDRGWEAFCDSKKLYSSANEVYSYVMKFCHSAKDHFYEVVEVEE